MWPGLGDSGFGVIIRNRIKYQNSDEMNIDLNCCKSL